MVDNLFFVIVNTLAYPFEFFTRILDKLDFTSLFIGGIVIAVSTRFILKPIFGGSAFSSIGSDSVKRRNNNYKFKNNNYKGKSNKTKGY